MNVTDVGKINIVSSQAVLEVSFSVKNRMLRTAPDIDKPPFQLFIQSMDLSVVDTLLHDSLDLVIHRTEICAVWRPHFGRKKFGVS